MQHGRIVETGETAQDDVPMALPALARAVKLQGRAARAGFDWPGMCAKPTEPAFEPSLHQLVGAWMVRL